MIARSTLFERFTGRDEELAHLSRLRAKSAREVNGCAVSITGEAGVGKSRLLAELDALGKGNRGAFVRVVCEELPVAYAPFVAALDALRGLRGAREDDALSKAIDSARASLTVADVAAKGDAAERKRTNLNLLVAAFGRAARRLGHLTLAIDDAHWSDLSSLEALLALVRAMAGAPMLVLFTYRPEDLEDRYARAAAIAAIEREGVDRISLAPLRYGEMAALLRIPVPDADAAVTRRIFELSEGRPYVAEELARSFLERGSDFELTSLSTLSSSVLKRAVALTTAHRNVIDHAAVIGRNFAPGDLQALGIPQDDLYGALRAGLELQLVEQTESNGEPWFRFRHALTREILYRHLPAPGLRVVHGEIAQCLANDDLRTAEFAYHLAAAGDADRAAPANERAGDRATELLAFADSIVLYARALDFVSPSGEDFARIALKIGRNFFPIGDSDELLALNLKNAELLVDGGRNDDAAALLLAIAKVLIASRFQRSVELLDRASGLLTASSPDRLRFDIELERVRIYIETGRLEEANDAFLRANAAVAEVPNDLKFRLVVFEIILAFFANKFSEMKSAIDKIPSALEPGPLREAQVKRYTAILERARCNVRPALALTLEAGELFESLEQHSLTYGMFANAATYAADLGDFPLVRSLLERAKRHGSEGGDAFVFARYRLVHALGVEMEWAAEAEEYASQHGSGTLVLALAAYRASMLDGDRKAARDVMLRAMTRLPIGKLDGNIVNAIVEYVGGEQAAELAAEYLAKPLRDATDEIEGALVRARQARQKHQAIEARKFARIALQLATPTERWLQIFTAQELLGDIDAARATLLRVGATAELARFEARHRTSTRKAAFGKPKLTQREEQIARAYAAGSSSTEIGDRLAIKARTVENHLANVYAKFGINSRAGLIEALGSAAARE